MSEVKEGSSYSREVLDEATVEVNEAYKSLHISLVLQDRALTDSSDFNRVHRDLVL